jgi:hypothetical protein
MYKESFKDLVNFANAKSELISLNLKNTTNPFYIGFGNPNSKILIVGQEKAINIDNEIQIKAESTENPKQWNYLVENRIDDIDHKFYSDYYFKNPLHPYDGKPTKGNTWLQYQKLINLVLPDHFSERNNSFLLNSFITEINHQVSPKQLGNKENEERQAINNHIFYKRFNITILAIGRYLANSEIESRYNVNFFQDYSKPRQRFLAFSNESEKRIVVNIRQLSNDISTDYLKKIAEIIKKYI